MAAQWEYDSSMASDLFSMALLKSGAQTLPQPKWPPGFLALAIDPLFAPALLTVGSLEYQHGFVKEAMELFLTLTKLPNNEEDLAKIIDKAGNFLLDHDDYKNALELYLSAERADPTQALYYIGSGYCFYKLGNIEEAIRKERRAVELEPDNYLHLNDLGYSLLKAGLLEEAETILKKSISLAPSEYEFARNNLELLYERKRMP
jgi:tetratricopeptide (TPR) repeat protein